MTNIDNGTENPMPFNTNINWIAVGGAFAVLFAYFFPNLPPNVREAFLLLAGVAALAGIAFVHSLINHKANGQAALKLVRFAELSARRGVGALVLLFVMGLALMGCAGWNSATPQQILSAAQTGFNTALTIYNGICETNSSASFCSPADMATAAVLEKGISDAIALAQIAIRANSGGMFSSADVQTAIQKVEDAVNRFEDFVNNLAAAKAQRMAAIRRATEARP